jgi:hypothetical protein
MRLDRLAYLAVVALSLGLGELLLALGQRSLSRVNFR